MNSINNTIVISDINNFENNNNLKIKLNFDDTIYSPEVISSELQSIKGPIDIYWLEF